MLYGMLVVWMAGCTAQVTGLWSELVEQAPEVARFEDINIQQLEDYGVVRISEDHSVLISEGLAAVLNAQRSMELPSDSDPDAPEFPDSLDHLDQPNSGPTYIHTAFNSTSPRFEHSDWRPAGKCFDNRFSTSGASYSQTVETTVADNMGPIIRFLVLFLRFSITPTLLQGHALATEMTCHVTPGSRLQIFQREFRLRLPGVRQRRVTLESSMAGFRKYLTPGSWVHLPKDHFYIVTSRHTACVTNEALLQCE